MEKLVLRQGQVSALDQLKLFTTDHQSKVFILKGYAGTGKTTLLRMYIQYLKDSDINFRLLASTGRAAKVVSNITDISANTVHSMIYSFKELNQDISEIVESRNASGGVDSTGQLLLNFELVEFKSENEQLRLYIIDEASMISDCIDKNAQQAMFGSGKLLSDLFRYDPNGRFVFVGDECQLPPVIQSFSPALHAPYIRETYGYNVKVSVLTEIVRQEDTNDIIPASQKIRELFNNPPLAKWAKFPMRGYADIQLHPNQASLIDSYIHSINENGLNSCTCICYSNKLCDTLTTVIRPKLGIQAPTLQKGDLLLITQNNYISGLMNGDLVMLENIGVRNESLSGLSFVQVTVKELFSGKVYSQLLIENIVYSNQTNVTAAEQKELYIDYFLRMKEKGIHHKSEAFRLFMFSDPYLNALRAVYGYALTCHKSQGGEWDDVYLDIAKYVPGIEKPYVYQWIYTAMTRAKKRLHLVDDWWIS